MRAILGRFAAASLVAIIPVAPGTAEKLSKSEQAAVGATPDQIAATARVVDDPLDTNIRVDTEGFFVQKSPFFGTASGDKYFRAFIDRRTGETALQLVLWQRHGQDWQLWDRAVAEGPDGPTELKGHRLESNVSCGTYGCSYLESVAVDIDEPLLRWVAADAKAGVDNSWWMKIYGRYVDGVKTGILKTEAAGFLIAVQRARSRLRLAAPAAAARE